MTRVTGPAGSDGPTGSSVLGPTGPNGPPGTPRYTLDELDEALAESVGPAAWVAYSGPGFSRVMVLDRAATARWWAKTPEDHNAAILRAAYADLSKDGALRPAGGWGDDKGEAKEPWE